jgi:hypothetical protein
MENPGWIPSVSSGPRARPGHARARRLLLQQLRQAIAIEPAALDPSLHLPATSLSNIRGRISIMIGTIVVRLNREGFDQSDRVYLMRDSLASGRPVEPADVEWLNAVIADEAYETTAREGSPAL